MLKLLFKVLLRALNTSINPKDFSKTKETVGKMSSLEF